jgi:hypothetical protein
VRDVSVATTAVVVVIVLGGCSFEDWGKNPSAVSSGSRAPANDHQNVWFHPSAWSQQYYGLYYHPDTTWMWEQVRTEIDVVSFRHNKLDDALDEQMDNIVNFFENVDTLTKMAFMGPVIHAGDPFAQSSFATNGAVIARVEADSGHVDYWYSEESAFRALYVVDGIYRREYGITEWEEILE